MGSIARYVLCCTLTFLSAGALRAQEDSTDWRVIEEVLGRAGTIHGDFFKITFPRTDLYVTVDGIAVEPALALTGWFGFMPHGPEVMVMGDMVLTESEIQHVELKLMQEGFQITALHNHLLGETPPVKYLHVEGSGAPTVVAEKLKAALALTATPMTPTGTAPSNIDWSTIEAIIGARGEEKGPVLQIALPRAEKIMENEMELPPFLGMASSLNFQMVDDNVAATGDFVLIASEVNPVIAALTENNIEVTAVHNHMLDEVPRLFMLHFWGFGSPTEVAHGLRTALDRVALKN